MAETETLVNNSPLRSVHQGPRPNNFGTKGGAPFNLRGGGRVSGMDQNIFFTMIQQMYIFFQLRGKQIIYFILELFQLHLDGNYLFSTVGSYRLFILPASCLTLFISKISPPPLEIK